MKKLLLITGLLLLVLSLSTVCFAAGRDTSNYVMSVAFVIDEPYPGRSLDFTADSSSGVVVESVIWQKEGEINDAGTNTQVTAGKWNLRITFSLAAGKTGISTNNIVSINDKSGLNWSKDENGKYYVETSYDITASTGSRPSTSTGTFTRPTTSTPTRPSTGTVVTRPTSTTISTVEFTIPELKVGEKQIEKDAITTTTGISITNMSWTNVTGKAFMTTNETYRENYKYSIRVYFTALSGYKLAESFEVKVNGDKVSVTDLDDGSGKYLFDKEFTCAKKVTEPEPETKESISKVDITVPEVTVGKVMIPETDVKLSKGAKLEGYSWTNDTTNLFMTDDEKYEEGSKYSVNIFFKPDTGYEFKDVKVTLNGEAITPVVVTAPDYLKVTKTYELKKAEEEKPEETKTEPVWVNKFDIEVAAPKIGDKPATKATAKTKGYKISKIYWSADGLDSEVEKFAANTQYIFKAMIKIEDDYSLRSDYFGLVNGKQAEMPNDYDEKNFYVEFVFPELEENSTRSWEKASSWAVDELSKANENGLIPASLDKQDLTKNITRKEFAHIAVKLYENLTGKGVSIGAENNPFTDVKDNEVLKAYVLGITAGVTETTFAPDREITREQMATMMARALQAAGIDTFIDVSKATKFSDDSDLHDWSREAVYFMNSKDIIKGVSTTENRFGATGKATREQALLIAERSIALGND